MQSKSKIVEKLATWNGCYYYWLSTHNFYNPPFLCFQGASNRKVAATNMNRASSRSHSVFTCIIESKVSKIYENFFPSFPSIVLHSIFQILYFLIILFFFLIISGIPKV